MFQDVRDGGLNLRVNSKLMVVESVMDEKFQKSEKNKILG